MLFLESCQELSGLQVETQEAWYAVGMVPGPCWFYDNGYVFLSPCQSDSVLCRISMQPVVVWYPSHFHLSGCFPILGVSSFPLGFNGPSCWDSMDASRRC